MWIFVFMTIFLNCFAIRGEIKKVQLHMPGVRPKENDSYICTTLKLPSDDYYIVKYEPDAHKETAHHMLLFGCEEPGSHRRVWNCGDMGSGTCMGSESILFGWARDAPALKLPEDVGFKVGGETKIKYLTLQIHYAHALEAKHYDKSGLTIHMTTIPQLNVASIYLLMAVSAYIPPHSQGIHVDIACKYQSDQEINAFAFRTHAHDLGRVITGYRIRNNIWTLLGKGDPHAPQAFYPMDNVTTIKKGDILAARCTYDTINSGKTTATTIGSTASDEMCNFYMMYYRDASSNIATPEICGDQYTYERLYDSFPNGSDVPLHSSPGHHHHHGHQGNESANIEKPGTKQGTENNPGHNITDEVRTTAKSSEKTSNHANIANDWDDVTTGDDVTIGEEDVKDDVIGDVDDVTSNKNTVQSDADQQAGELTTENPTQKTKQLQQIKTSPSTSDVTTSTSVSEQTTTPSDFVPDPSTRLDVKVSTKTGSKIPRTTRSAEKLQSTQSFLDNNGGVDKVTVSSSPEHSHVRPSVKSEVEKFNVSVVDAWPSRVTEGLGQVTGLAVDSAGRLFVFHRSERTWDYDTFNLENTFRDPQTRGPIRGATLLIIDGNSGEVLEQHGQNMFYLPHGLTIDDEDNVYVTDVGRHQVMKFSRGEFQNPSVVLGENLVPGSGYKHFCKPTDIAVEKSGVFYVSDGYCNGRIMKFSPEGGLLKVWGELSPRKNPLPSTFNIPHSLTLDEKRNMLYVADRENGRIQCFDTEGRFHKEISSPKFGGLVFAVNYNKIDDVLYAVNSGGNAKVQGFTINPSSGSIISSWSPHDQGFSQPHAVVSNGSYIYVGEIGPNRVWKLEHPSAVSSEDENYVRGLNAAVLVPNPTEASNDVPTNNDDNSREKPEPSNRPGLVILAVLSVPVVILLAVGLVSRLTRRRHRLPKYDMMDASLGDHSISSNWCHSMNCCNKQYRNMEELYLMDSDSDLEIYPDVHVDRK